MNVEKVGPQPPDKGKQKVSEGSEPDTEAFKEMMKIGKTKEPELDEQGKRRLFGTEEEEEEEEETEPTSSDIYYYKEQAKPSTSESEETIPEQMKSQISPTSPDIYKQTSKKKIDPEKEKEIIALLDKELKKVKKETLPSEMAKEKKIMEEEKQKEIAKPNGKKEHLAKETVLSEKAQAIKEAEFKAFKEPVKRIEKEKTEKLSEKKKAIEAKAEKREEKIREKKEISSIEKKEKKLSQKVKEKEKKEEISIPYHTLELTPATQAQAQSITAKIESNLNPEIIPIIEHMIGAMIQFKNKGVSETQIILNNPKFSNSRFYNSKIIFEKYATAPHSFNIRLTGSQEAVTVFNENIEGLYKKLNEADLDFTIGQLSAEYERPLFKRKAPISGGDKKSEE